MIRFNNLWNVEHGKHSPTRVRFWLASATFFAAKYRWKNGELARSHEKKWPAGDVYLQPLPLCKSYFTKVDSGRARAKNARHEHSSHYEQRPIRLPRR